MINTNVTEMNNKFLGDFKNKVYELLAATVFRLDDPIYKKVASDPNVSSHVNMYIDTIIHRRIRGLLEINGKPTYKDLLDTLDSGNIFITQDDPFDGVLLPEHLSNLFRTLQYNIMPKVRLFNEQVKSNLDAAGAMKTFIVNRRALDEFTGLIYNKTDTISGYINLDDVLSLCGNTVPDIDYSLCFNPSAPGTRTELIPILETISERLDSYAGKTYAELFDRIYEDNRINLPGVYDRELSILFVLLNGIKDNSSTYETDRTTQEMVDSLIDFVVREIKIYADSHLLDISNGLMFIDIVLKDDRGVIVDCVAERFTNISDDDADKVIIAAIGKTNETGKVPRMVRDELDVNNLIAEYSTIGKRYLDPTYYELYNTFMSMTTDSYLEVERLLIKDGEPPKDYERVRSTIEHVVASLKYGINDLSDNTEVVAANIISELLLPNIPIGRYVEKIKDKLIIGAEARFAVITSFFETIADEHVNTIGLTKPNNLGIVL